MPASSVCRTVTDVQLCSPERGTSIGRKPTILHYTHHSVGLGHLVRSLAVAESLAARFRVGAGERRSCPRGPTP